jgi:large subunit ribosomal protein L5
MNRLKEKYLNEIVPSFNEKFNYKSVMQVPKIEKIVINMGVGDAVQNAKALDTLLKN